ncbi:MAG: cation diffusion facilitator family transporter [Deltaproteobacteria bacterium]|nr:cation diffusion facilitator family transporter [Deltaproteobacteria bacterium]
MQENSDGILAAKKERALRIGVLTTFASLLPTAYATYISNSVILFTDLLRCAVEFCAILLAWILLRHVARGDRSRFNYGYGKLEQISSVVVAVAMLATFFAVIIAAVTRFTSPQMVKDAQFGFVLGLLSVAGNVALWTVYKNLARQALSPMMESQWRLFRAKTCASGIVVVSLLPSMSSTLGATFWYADPLGSLFLSGFLLYSAMGLFSSSMRELLDSSLEEGLQLAILKTLVQFDSDYSGFRALRSRRSGNKVFVDLFLEFEPAVSMSDFTSISNRMSAELARSIPGCEVAIIPSVRTS